MRLYVKCHPAVCAGLVASVGMLSVLAASPVVAYGEVAGSDQSSQAESEFYQDGFTGEFDTPDMNESSGNVMESGSGSSDETFGSQDGSVDQDNISGDLVSGDSAVIGSGQGDAGSTTDNIASGEEASSSELGGVPASGAGAAGLSASNTLATDALDASNEVVVESGSMSISNGGVTGWNGLSYNDANGNPYTGWVVDDHAGGGLQRYYIRDGTAVTGLFEEVLAGVRSWFYAHGDGSVVRGKWDNGAGRVYLADNEGRLAALGADGCGSGWLVTGAYDGGQLQRYYIGGESHAAVSGYFNVDASGNLTTDGSGESYFGVGGEGYVLRGTGRGVRKDWLVADNDGKLAKNEWIVTSAFGQGLQRYWFDGTATIAKQGVYHTGGGWWTYVTDAGYVLRGKLDTGHGRVYVADNDGRLAGLGADGTASGWLVTGAYDGGTLQRYFIDGTTHAAVSGFFKVDGSSYFGLGGRGYVLRGHTGWGSNVLLANNDGVMPGTEGWVVSSAYGQGLQRYWIEGISGQAGYFGAMTGFFSVGESDYYGRSDGYVLRGGMVVGGRFVYANNDGVILERSKAIDAFVNFMIKIANDDSHGYTQGDYRWGQFGDYDCSALVITALRHAGLDTGAADNTRDMRQELTKHGFDWLTSPSSLEKGDILLWENNHTAVYIGNGLIAHAIENEFGGIMGGKPGDQTGREIRIQTYASFSKSWDGILRLKK